MLIETFILDRYKGFAHVVGNLVHTDGETVGVGADVLVDLIAFSVIDDRGFSYRYDIGQPDRGSGREDAAENTDTGCYTADANAYDSSKHDLDTGQCELPSPFL